MRRVQIIGSYLSPYVRKVLVVLDLKGLPYEIDPIVPFFGDDLEKETVDPQERVGRGKCDAALVAVQEALTVGERFHQHCGFFFERAVVAGLRTENGGLNCALVADTMKAAE